MNATGERSFKTRSACGNAETGFGLRAFRPPRLAISRRRRDRRREGKIYNKREWFDTDSWWCSFV